MGFRFAAEHSFDQAIQQMQVASTASPPDLEIYQQQKLAEAWERARLSQHYGDLGRFSMESFRRLPPTPRRALKEAPQAFDTIGFDEAVKYYETSGTTGVPTPTLRTFDDIIWNHASVYFQWRELVGPSDRCVIFLPSDVTPIGDLIAGVCELIGACTLRCFPLTQGVVTWDRIDALSARYRPTVVWSSPGTLIQMMRILKRRGTFASFVESVKTIMLSGEVVSDGLRGMLTREWRADVHNASYGSTETGTIAAANAQDELRILEYSYVCELETPTGLTEAVPGASGELVITTLNNFARPLLRFNTGDVVAICPGGQVDTKSVRIFGRQNEVVDLGGRSLSVMEIEDLVYSIKGVTGYQIRLDKEGPATIALESDPDYEGALEEVKEGATVTLRDHGVEADVAIFSELPLTTKSGASQKNWKRTHVVAT